MLICCLVRDPVEGAYALSKAAGTRGGRFFNRKHKSFGMVPVKKTSKCCKRKRRSHLARRAAALTACPKCSRAKLPHCACSSCGFVSAKLMLPIHEEES